jgi:predicted DNA-binding protein
VSLKAGSTAHVSDDVHERLKILAFLTGKTMRGVIQELINREYELVVAGK